MCSSDLPVPPTADDVEHEALVAENTVWKHLGYSTSAALVKQASHVLLYSTFLAQQSGVLQAKPQHTPVLQLVTVPHGVNKSCVVYVRPLAGLTDRQYQQLIVDCQPEHVRVSFELARLEITALYLSA